MSTVTFENVCRAHTKRQVLIKMNKFNMFITAVCFLFLTECIPMEMERINKLKKWNAVALVLPISFKL